jgi:hypothetical protein
VVCFPRYTTSPGSRPTGRFVRPSNSKSNPTASNTAPKKIKIFPKSATAKFYINFLRARDPEICDDQCPLPSLRKNAKEPLPWQPIYCKIAPVERENRVNSVPHSQVHQGSVGQLRPHMFIFLHDVCDEFCF